MLDLDPKRRAERAQWLLDRYPDVTPEELHEIAAHLKQWPDLTIDLLEEEEEVRAVFVRLPEEEPREGARPRVDGPVLAAVAALAGLAMWTFATAQ